MIEVLKQALEALEECRRDPRLKNEHPTLDRVIASLRQAIAELESQEPVAWMREDGTLRFADGKMFAVGQPFYTHPPQRTWVGLTEEEIQAVLDKPEPFYDTMFWFARTIERKLKEKNNGV